ncbi:lysozyme [Parasphingorhabdus pacifica]
MVLPHNVHSTPPRKAAAMVLALTIMAAGLLSARTAEATDAPKSDGNASPAATGSPPRLDRHDPHGAWAGYSIDTTRPGSGQRGRTLPAGTVAGMDVSGHQGDVDWRRAWADGARFTYVKATEGTGFRNSHFAQQYDGSYAVGMVRGAYHYALPDRSTGAAQAHYFVDHGGGWSPDGRTLPGALDIEHNPYGPACYGLDPRQMSRWLADFSNTYHQRTGRFPAIYTTTNWWNECTGANPHFGRNNPLWVARYNDFLGALPAGWNFHTIWQFDNSGIFPGDQNSFNGGYPQLLRFTR